MFVTYTIIGATVLISMLAFNRPAMLAEFMMNPYKIRTQGQYFRFLTSGFIHQDHMHLILNMFSLYFFGQVIEQIFGMIWGDWGTVYYIALYLLAISYQICRVILDIGTTRATIRWGHREVWRCHFCLYSFPTDSKNLSFYCVMSSWLYIGHCVHHLFLLPGKKSERQH